VRAQCLEVTCCLPWRFRIVQVPLAMTEEWGDLGYVDPYGSSFSKIRVILNPTCFT
jgi:hypothetical protein